MVKMVIGWYLVVSGGKVVLGGAPEGAMTRRMKTGDLIAREERRVSVCRRVQQI